MALNPIAYTEQVVRSFLRYQLTAYPFADPRLHRQMRDLLSLDETRRSPLLKGPYVSLSRPFRLGATVDALIRDGLLHPHLRERIPEAITHLYGHQERALHAIADGRTTLISTGTGSGKTECFLYPIVSRCLSLRDDAAPPGISAVIVYPMNALAEDQLMRLRGLLAGTDIPFGMYVGKTPEHEAGVAGVRLPAGSSRADYEARLARARHDGKGETVYPSEEVCSREVMRSPGRQPRILAHQRQAAREVRLVALPAGPDRSSSNHEATGCARSSGTAAGLRVVRRRTAADAVEQEPQHLTAPSTAGLVPLDLERNGRHAE